jgi:hypothetical protein
MHSEYGNESGGENEERFTHIEYEENDYKELIIKERSKEMKELSQDIEQLAEISQILGKMVYTQGEKIDILEKNIEESNFELEKSVLHLEKANDYALQLRKNIRNTAIVVGSITAGAFGFLAGPIVGIATTVSGVAAGFGIVFAAEKKETLL